MADRSQGAGGEDGDWIFQADPGTFATEQLPDREDFDRLVAERAAQQEAQRNNRVEQ